MLLLDAVWLKFVMVSRYNELVPRVQGGRPMEVNYAYAALAYAAMALGMHELVAPAADRARAGVVWGLLAYGTYNGTAGAVFRDWDPQLAVLDVAWGALLGHTVATRFM